MHRSLSAYQCHVHTPFDIFVNPYPANVEEYVELLIMPANGRWDLTRHLKG